ncbi:hypothetical protein BSLG_002016 [Batrachochytrium salamandrivorans]|nr:hypothetical protein BSLG_002016 [Batrachochytrium salamandrivorans]
MSVCYRRRRLLLLSLATSGMDLSCRRHHHWNPLLIHSVFAASSARSPLDSIESTSRCSYSSSQSNQNADRTMLSALQSQLSMLLRAKILIPPHLKQRQNHLIPEPPTTSNLPAALDSPDLSYGQDQRPAQDAYPDRTVSLDCIIGLIQRINSVQAATDAKHDMIQSVLSCLQRCRISLNMILQTAYTLPAMASISSHAAAVQTLQEIASRGRFQLDILIYTYVLGALCRYAPENSNDPQQFADALPKPWIDQTYIAVLSWQLKTKRIAEFHALVDLYRYERQSQHALGPGLVNAGVGSAVAALPLEIYALQIQAASWAGRFEQLSAVIEEMTRKGVVPDVPFLSILAKSYAMAGDEPAVREILCRTLQMATKGSQRSEVSIWKSIIEGARKHQMLRLVDEGVTVLLGFGHVYPAVLTFNAALSACIRCQRAGHAIKYFETMLRSKVAPNYVTVGIMMNAMRLSRGPALRNLKRARDAFLKIETPNANAFDAMAMASLHLEHTPKDSQRALDQLYETMQRLSLQAMYDGLCRTNSPRADIRQDTVMIKGYTQSWGLDQDSFSVNEPDDTVSNPHSNERVGMANPSEAGEANEVSPVSGGSSAHLSDMDVSERVLRIWNTHSVADRLGHPKFCLAFFEWCCISENHVLLLSQWQLLRSYERSSALVSMMYSDNQDGSVNNSVEMHPHSEIGEGDSRLTTIDPPPVSDFLYSKLFDLLLMHGRLQQAVNVVTVDMVLDRAKPTIKLAMHVLNRLHLNNKMDALDVVWQTWVREYPEVTARVLLDEPRVPIVSASSTSSSHLSYRHPDSPSTAMSASGSTTTAQFHSVLLAHPSTASASTVSSIVSLSHVPGAASNAASMLIDFRPGRRGLPSGLVAHGSSSYTEAPLTIADSYEDDLDQGKSGYSLGGLFGTGGAYSTSTSRRQTYDDGYDGYDDDSDDDDDDSQNSDGQSRSQLLGMRGPFFSHGPKSKAFASVDPLFQPLIASSIEDQDSSIYIEPERRPYNDVSVTFVYMAAVLFMLIWGIISATNSGSLPPSSIISKTLYFAFFESSATIILLTLVSVIVGAIWLATLSHFARPIIYFTAVAIPSSILLVSTITLFVSLSASYTQKTPDTLSEIQAMIVIAFFGIAVAVWLGMYIWRRRSMVDTMTHIIELSCDILHLNPSLFGLSVALMVAHALFSAIWLVLFSRLFLVGSITVDPSGDVSTPGFVPSKNTPMIAVFFVVMYFWTSAIFQNLEKTTVASVVGGWYFQDLADSPTHDSDQTWRNFKHVSTRSFGPIAFASLVLGAIQAIKYLISKILNTGLTGDSFMDSAYSCTRLFRRNLILGLVTQSVAKIIGVLGRALVAATIGLAVFWGTVNRTSAGVGTGGNEWVVAGVSTIVPYYVMGVLTRVVENTIDSTFICYLIDLDTNSCHCEGAHRIFSESLS